MAGFVNPRGCEGAQMSGTKQMSYWGIGIFLATLPLAGCGQANGEALGNDGGESIEGVGTVSEALMGVPSPAPLVTFKGSGSQGVPPDTMGAVGPNHVVTIINSRVIVQTRSGVTLTDVDLGEFFGSVLRPGLGAFDPRAAFDPFANRFILCAPSGGASESTIVLAVSETSDPTGDWRFYAIRADPLRQRWADHDALGLNSKWIVIQANMIDSASETLGLFVIDKAALYAHRLSYRKIESPESQTVPAITYDAAEPDLYLVGVKCKDCGSSGSGELRLLRLTGAVGSETLVSTIVNTDPWGDGQNAPQQGTTALLDFRLTWIQNVVMRNGSIWATHHVGMPAIAPTHSAVRWLQIQPNPAVVLQQGTIDDPTGVNFYGMPSIAVNSQGDALVGYTRTSVNQFASASYSARDATDPLGTMRGERVYRAGEAPYGTDGEDGTRWGDYSNTVVDVDGTAFWTIQEIAVAPRSSYELWWARVSAPEPTCNVASAQDLGPRTSSISVASNACVKVSQYPSWWQFTNGLVTLQAGTGTFPVPATWTDSCTNATGSVSFSTPWQSLPIGSHTATCPVVIKLNGSGAPLQLSWW